ncbi:MAG: zf-HC2 domain-containing protein [Thiotrichaceae bacterium]|nr:zf-HC2 domain-containing protein [Thiotrichaceae bacterium]
MTQCDKVENLLSGYLDGELTQQESQQVRIHIESCESCKQLYAELRNQQKAIQSIHVDVGEEAALQKIMNDLGARQTQKWGWIFIIFASVLMILFSVSAFIISNDMSIFEKLMLSLFCIGGMLLFGSVLRQRIIASKTDKYKDINL